MKRRRQRWGELEGFIWEAFHLSSLKELMISDFLASCWAKGQEIKEILKNW
jgi:hypothetical protein